MKRFIVISSLSWLASAAAAFGLLGDTEEVMIEKFGSPQKVHPLYLKFYKSTLSSIDEPIAFYKLNEVEIISVYYPDKAQQQVVGEVVYKFPKGLKPASQQAAMISLIKENVPEKKDKVDFEIKGKSIKTVRGDKHVIQYKEFLNTLRILPVRSTGASYIAFMVSSWAAVDRALA
ncbi:MAG: hypothetical protein AAF492_28345, partial [Verrucomicrobiota bacterium]